MSNGAHTTQARTIIQTVSGPGWSSIICALDPTDTGILNNDWLPPWNFLPNKITPIKGNDKPFPCVFETIKQQNSSLKTAFYYDWDWLQYLGNKHMRGDFIDEEVFCKGYDLEKTLKCDEDHVVLAENLITSDDFDFFILYLDALDDTGHKFSWGSPEYLAEIEILDGYLGRIFSALEKKGIMDETYILVTSDHGGRIGMYDHGEQNDENLFVPWFFMGPNIRKNYELKGNIHNMDTVPTLLHAMGLRGHYLWRGEIVYEAFMGNDDGDF